MVLKTNNIKVTVKKEWKQSGAGLQFKPSARFLRLCWRSLKGWHGRELLLLFICQNVVSHEIQTIQARTPDRTGKTGNRHHKNCMSRLNFFFFYMKQMRFLRCLLCRQKINVYTHHFHRMDFMLLIAAHHHLLAIFIGVQRDCPPCPSRCGAVLVNLNVEFAFYKKGSKRKKATRHRMMEDRCYWHQNATLLEIFRLLSQRDFCYLLCCVQVFSFNGQNCLSRTLLDLTDTVCFNDRFFFFLILFYVPPQYKSPIEFWVAPIIAYVRTGREEIPSM